MQGVVVLDELDRRLVAALAIWARAPWGQIGKAVGASETTVARRYQRIVDAGVLRIAAAPDPVACGMGTPVFVHADCEQGQARVIADRLAQRADARYVALLAGPSHVVAELIAADRAHLTRMLVDELGDMPGVRGTSYGTVLRTFVTRFDWSRELLGDGVTALEVPDTATPIGPVPLDEVDLAIITELGIDGRRSSADLASRLGVSESMATRRVRALVARGCLHFAPVIDPAQLGFDVEALIRLRVDLPRIEDAATVLREHVAVRYLSVTTGASDLVCEVVLPNSDALYRFITKTLAALPGLREAETSIELVTVKRSFGLYADARIATPMKGIQ